MMKTAFRPEHLFKTAQAVRKIAIIPVLERAVETPLKTGPPEQSFVAQIGQDPGKLFSHLELAEH
jgi:hypothetical protein